MASSADGTKYQAGKIITTYKPFAKCPYVKFRLDFCNYCFTAKSTIKLSPCKKCYRVVYCTVRCRKTDWNFAHKLECTYWRSGYFKESAFQDDHSSLLFRLYCILRLKPELITKKVDLKCGPDRCLDDMVLNPRGLVPAPLERYERILLADCKDYARFFNEIYREINNQEKLSDYVYVVLCNERIIPNSKNDFDIGIGIFIEPGFSQQSCKPNAILCRKGENLQLRAIATIEKDDEPRLDFIGDCLKKIERQCIFNIKYGVYCSCSICQSDADDNVDYDGLTRLLSSAVCISQTDVLKEIDWPTAIELHNNIMTIFTSIYHKYDMRITEQFRRHFFCAVKLKVERNVLVSLAEETLNYLTMTYGSDYSGVIEFKKLAIEQFGTANWATSGLAV